MLMISRSMEAR